MQIRNFPRRNAPFGPAAKGTTRRVRDDGAVFESWRSNCLKSHVSLVRFFEFSHHGPIFVSKQGFTHGSPAMAVDDAVSTGRELPVESRNLREPRELLRTITGDPTRATEHRRNTRILLRGAR